MHRGAHLTGRDLAPVETMKIATAEATAKALAVAKQSAKNEGCLAAVEVDAVITVDGEVTNSANCKSLGVGFTQNEMKAAYAAAGARPKELCFLSSCSSTCMMLRFCTLYL